MTVTGSIGTGTVSSKPETGSRINSYFTYHSFEIDPCQMMEGQIPVHTIGEKLEHPHDSIVSDHSLKTQRKESI